MTTKEETMSKGALNNWAEVQAFLTANSGTVSGAPHQSFWTNLTYDEFVDGCVPDLGGQNGGPPCITNPPSPPPPASPPVKILVKGNSKQSNIYLALSGEPPFDGSIFSQMPEGGPFLTTEQLAQFAAWIDAGCPK